MFSDRRLSLGIFIMEETTSFTRLAVDGPGIKLALLCAAWEEDREVKRHIQGSSTPSKLGCDPKTRQAFNETSLESCI